LSKTKYAKSPPMSTPADFDKRPGCRLEAKTAELLT
jgi:hypothetical protein